MISWNDLWNAKEDKIYMIQSLNESKWEFDYNRCNGFFGEKEIPKILQKTIEYYQIWGGGDVQVRIVRVSRYLPDHDKAEPQVLEVVKFINIKND